jgi:hypothetical protein
MTPPTLTIGIDLASQPKKTGFCAIRWGGAAPLLTHLDRGSVAEAKLDDNFLATAIRGLPDAGFDGVRVAKVGIDAPFGWPDPFVEAVQIHQSGKRWPRGIDQPRAPFERRETDRFIKEETGKNPLSVSTDRIAYPAMRCAVILGDVAEDLGPKAVARDGSGLVCEVYPDPALRFWTAGDSNSLAPREKYKGPAASKRRSQLAKIIASRVGLDDPDRLLRRCSGEDDFLDALVCALVARAAELNLTLPPPNPNSARLARREGWIHHPGSPLGDLASR